MSVIDISTRRGGSEPPSAPPTTEFRVYLTVQLTTLVGALVKQFGRQQASALLSEAARAARECK